MPASPTSALENEDDKLNPSTEGQASSEGQENTATGTENAESSNADSKPSMLDAVKAALGGEAEQSSGSGSEKGGENDPAKPAEGADPKAGEVDESSHGLSEEELGRLNAKTRERIVELSGKVKSANDQVRTLQPMADRMAKIESFVQQNGLSSAYMTNMFDGAVKLKNGGLTEDDFRTGVEVMLAVNNDPIKAYALLTPIMQSLAALNGEILSPELAAQVEAGEITQEAAQEISRARAGKVVTTHQATVTQKRQEDDAAAQRQSELNTQGASVEQAINGWEKNWKGRDPDHSHKYALWRDKMDVYIARIETGKEALPDAKAVVAKAEQFLKEVTTTLTKMRPSKTAIRSTPQGVGTSTGAKAVPGTLKEAIQGALAR